MIGRFAIPLLLAVAVLLPAVTFAQNKPVAALGRIVTVGKINEGQRTILRNQLKTFLSRSYNLISENDYMRAEDEAFAVLEEDQCTERNCVQLIQEFLQVERLFIAQLVQEEGLTQITLTLYLRERLLVESDICEQCPLLKLNDRMEALARLLIASDWAQRADIAQDRPPKDTARSAPTWALWTGGIALVVGGVLLAQGLSDARNAESKASDARANVDDDKFKSAEDEGNAADQLMLIGGVTAGVGVGLLAAYFLFGPDEEDSVTMNPVTGELLARPWSLGLTANRVTVGYEFNW